MSARVSTFSRGIISAVSGEGGTQSNEFEAAIKSVTSSTTVGAVFLYDTSADSDGGKWRNKCKGLSWFDEPTLPAGTAANQWNSATRSARKQFPSMALIVADNVDGVETLTLYDLDDTTAPLWMQFKTTAQAAPYYDFWRGSRTVKSISMLNGVLCFGVNDNNDQEGLKVVDFTADTLATRGTAIGSEWNGFFDANIANRNSTTKVFLGNTFNPIVHDNVNDVAMTVLEGAPIGALGLPEVTIAVATAGGVSVIHANGSVYDIAEDGTANNPDGISFDENNNIITAWNTITSGTRYTYAHKIPFADEGADDSPLIVFGDSSTTTNVDLHYSNVGERVQNVVGISGGHAMGRTAGLTLHKYNQGNPAEGAVAYITSAYNTGMMMGDIRFAMAPSYVSQLSYDFTNGDSFTDRSVKANALTTAGTITVTPAATGETLGISGFSSSNYLSISDADQGSDFDFGTGDFSVMFWAKSAATGTGEHYISRSDATSESGDWVMVKHSDESLKWYRNNGSEWVNIATSVKTIGANWAQVNVVRRGGKLNIYIDGQLDVSETDANSYTPSGGSALVVGHGLWSSTPATNASLSLLRISATAPSPKQVKEIYNLEKPLFQAGAKCTLQSTSAYSPNHVIDLAYDKSTELLTVGQYANTSNVEGIQRFRGLEMVDQLDGKATVGWSEGSAYKLATSGGVTSAYHSSTPGGVLVDLPALDVRAELNEGEDKTPNDGKLHFEGVTANTATPTIIGFIPIEEGEQYVIRAKTFGNTYQDGGSYHAMVEEETRFYSEVGGNVLLRSQERKLSNTSTGLDVELVTTTSGAESPASVAASANYIMIKVTGTAAKRMLWKAEVEVQRVSDKLYER